MIKKLMRNKMQIVFIMGLSVLSFFLCLIALTNSFAFREQEREIQQMFCSDINEVNILEFSYVSDFEQFGYDISEIKSYIRENYGFVCGSYEEEFTVFDELFNNDDYIEKNRKLYKGTFYEDNPQVADGIWLDPDMMDIVDCSIQKEMLLPETIDGETYYPIYVGSEYKEIIKVGDILTHDTFQSKYVVRGYLTNSYWFDYNDPLTFPVSPMNAKFVASFSAQAQTDAMTQMSTVGQIFVKIDDTPDTFTADIENRASKKDIKLSIESVGNKLKKMKDDNMELVKSQYTFAIVVIVCSMISICALLCTFTFIRKREYGIRLAYGENKMRLTLVQIGRYGCFMLLAMLIAIRLTKGYWRISAVQAFVPLYEKTLTEYSIPIMMIIGMIFLIISNTPSIIMLNNLKLAELVQEEEI